MNMPKATQLCFFGLALILAPLVASYFFAISSAKTVYHSSATNQHLTTTTLGTVPADLLLATSVQVEDITSTTSTIPPITTTYIYNGVTDANFNQRMAGLLSHVHWLIDRASIGGIRSNTVINTDRGFLDRQIERTADNANDSINSTRSELSADISEINERLLLAESTLSGLSIAAASTSVMAANLTLNGHWLSGDGDDEGVFVSGGGFVGIGTSTPTSRLSVLGNMYLTGAFQDGLNSAGTLGMVLQSTGTSTRWVATSTLGFTGGGGVATFLALTDTPGSYTANRIMFTNSGGTTLTDSANFVFDGTNLGIGTTTPTTALSVVGDTTLDGDLTINDNVRIGGTIQASLMAPGRVLYSTAGSYLTDSGNFVFDGTNLGVGTSTPGSRLTVAGDFYLTGALRDGANASGTSGMVLQSTGTSTRWVATSTLGITGGGGSSLFTDGGATTYLTATGDNLAIGTTTATTRLTVDGSMNVTGNIDIPNTTSGAVGVLTMNGQRFLHGYDANNTPGENLFLGYQAGNFTLGSTTQPFAGVSNVGIGTDVLSALTEGSNNVAVGTAALANTTTGGSNTALGWFSMLANTTGAGNSAVGRSTLQSNTTGRFNSAFGNSAMEQNTTGENNVGMGAFALLNTTSGNNNVAVGRGALSTNVTHEGSVALGHEALSGATANWNVAVGLWTGSTITTGEGNTIIGAFSGDGITTGTNNTIIGAGVTGLASGLSNNIIIADGAGNRRINVDSSGNVGIGTTTPTSRLTVAGDFYLTGAFRDSTNASGTLGMVLQSTGTSTRWVATSTLGITGGSGSLFTDGGATTYLTATGDNLAIGTTTASSKLTVAGDLRLYGGINFGAETVISHYSNNILFGSFALGNNVDGYRTIAIGDLAGNSFNTGFGNVFIGNDAANNLSTTSGSVVIGDLAAGANYGGTSGGDMVIVGSRAGYSLQSGGSNGVMIGAFAGENVTTGGGNILLGYRAGDNITDGYGNIVIGYDLDMTSASDFQKLNIGNLLFGTGLDGSGTTLSSGNVGIGTNNPGARLEVVGDIISKGTEWTARPSIDFVQWQSLTYGNGLFVAVSNGGEIQSVMTSPDGINWTQRSAASANTWQSVTYGNGLFVAVSSDGTGDRVMTSPDGITWTSRTSAADIAWKSVTYGNGLFVAVANSGAGNSVMTSPDGINWTQHSAASTNAWQSVTYGNGLFVAVASSGTGNRVMTSSNGTTWTIRTSAADNNWSSITYGNGLFVAVASSGTGNRVMTSSNGTTWTIRTSAADNNWSSITYGNGLFVAVSNNGTIMTSPDGITWTTRISPLVNFWTSATYGNGLFVAVASFSEFAMTSGKPEVSALAHNNLYQGGMNIMGNVGIGTTTPSSILTVAGTIQSTDLLGGTMNLVTDVNGNIIRETSDERLKENVTTIENALDTVLALRGVRYKWIDKERFGDNFEIGFLAQEVDEVVPEVVQKGGDYWALNSKNLVAVVVEAIKEVWAKVLGHEERLVDLEAENAALKARLESVERELRIEDAPGTSTPPPVVEEESGDTETIEEPVEGTVEEDPEATTVVEPEPEEEEIIEEPVSEDVSVGEEG